MSMLRLGRNPDGTREVRILEPSSAKRQGWGGSALGSFSGTTLTVRPKTERRPPIQSNEIRRDRPICGAPLPGWRNQFTASPTGNGVCVRTPGHLDSHRSKHAMDADALRRRAIR